MGRGRRAAHPGCIGSIHRLEIVLVEPVGDPLAEYRPLYVCGAEVDATPDARIDDLLECLGESVEA
jgi:hypothetical protein